MLILFIIAIVMGYHMIAPPSGLAPPSCSSTSWDTMKFMFSLMGYHMTSIHTYLQLLDFTILLTAPRSTSLSHLHHPHTQHHQPFLAPRSELAYLIWTASAALFALPLTFLSCAAEVVVNAGSKGKEHFRRPLR
jgi:hypothetical protein